MTPIRSTQADDRFWVKVEKTETCWEWTSSMTPQGYGIFQTGGQNTPLMVSHKFAWELENGPVPEGMMLDHVCHNRKCVNPAHLRLATAKQNNENRGVLNKNNTSGVRGVVRRGNRWVGQVMHNRRCIHVGSFNTIADAEAAVIAKRNELFTHNDLDRLAA